MAWYKTGTITVTNGSTTVTGSGTSWITGIGIGEALYAPDGRIYEIANIVSATQLTLGSNYLGTTASAQTYQIVPTQSYIRDLAQQAAQLVADYAGVVSNAGTGKFGDGTLGAPGIRFVADEDTGFFRSASNEVKFVAGGAEQFKFNSSGLSSITPSVFSVNSSTNALRITQVGTGNALLVEDSTNPDATPFVIDQSGDVVIGYTQKLNIGILTPALQVHGSAPSQASVSLNSWATGTDTGANLFFGRGDAGSINDYSVIDNNDVVGNLRFYGADGTAMIEAAKITAAVDGTPGTNDMPGRLVFSTTDDGASTPTERMRIDSTGAVGIGTTSLGDGYGLRVSKTFVSDSGSNIFSFSSGSSGTPTNLYSFRSTVATVSNGGTPYTINAVYSYAAAQGTFHADSAVLNQYGFLAGSSFIGATNNFGFLSQIPAGTGRWNFYASGTASNFFGGNTIVQVTDNTNAALRITQIGTGNALLVEDSTNPDATPFVIDQVGRVIAGYTASIISPDLVGNQATPPLLTIAGTDSYNASLAIDYFAGTSSGASTFSLNKSRSATMGSHIVVANNDTIGAVQWNGSDGTNFIRAASITAAVDGAPGTNDMPGRLVFSTTPDGASAPLERMRIRSDGVVQVGANAGAAIHLKAGGVGFDGAINWTFNTDSTIFGSISLPYDTRSTVGLKLQTVNGYPITINAGSGVIFQEDGVETVRIDSAGRVGIGSSSLTGQNLRVGSNLTGAISSNGIWISGQIQSDVTTTANYITATGTQAAGGALTTLRYYNAEQGTVSGTVTNQFGFAAQSTLTGATNNYGFYSNIASGTGRWNFYANGTADNYFGGSVAIGLTTGFSSSRLTSRGIDATSSNFAFVAQNSSGSNIILVRNDGLVTATAISTTRTAVTAPAASDGNVFSGTYTPTLTNTTNIAASTALTCQYMRVGNVVTVSGRVAIDPTAVGQITMGFSLPIASNFGTSSQAGGTFSTAGVATVNVGGIYTDTVNDVVIFDGAVADVANRSYYFSFTYQVV